jgi:hypothetical protein
LRFLGVGVLVNRASSLAHSLVGARDGVPRSTGSSGSRCSGAFDCADDGFARLCNICSTVAQ